MLIGITLAIMVVITLFSIISGNSFIGLITETIIDNSVIVNGSTTSLEIPVPEGTFGLDPLTGGLVLITALAILGAVISIQVVGSGLGEGGVRILMISFFYGGLWGILSIVSANLIIAIEAFGLLIYLMLTILYAIGVVSKYFGGGVE